MLTSTSNRESIRGRGGSPGWITSSPEALSLSRATVTRSPHHCGENESADRTLPPGRSSTKVRPFVLVLESWRAVRLVADRFFHSHSDRPYPAESDPKCIPFSGGRRLHPRAKKTGERHGRCQIRKCMHLQAGSVAAGGRPDCPREEETRSPTRRIRNRFAHPSGTPPLRCRALHLSSSNWSWWTRRLSQCECETRLKRFTRRFDGRVFLIRF